MRKLRWKPRYFGDTLPALETMILVAAIFFDMAFGLVIPETNPVTINNQTHEIKISHQANEKSSNRLCLV